MDSTSVTRSLFIQRYEARMAIGTHTNRPAHLKPAPSFSLKGNQIGKKKSLTCAQTCYYRKSRASSHSVPSFFRSQMTSTPWFFFGGKWQSPFSSPNRKMKRNRERGLFLIYALSLGKQTLSGWITIIAHMCVRLHFVSLFFRGFRVKIRWNISSASHQAASSFYATRLKWAIISGESFFFLLLFHRSFKFYAFPCRHIVFHFSRER